MKRIFIKNMVCNRCIMVVRQELERQGIAVQQITLGEVVPETALTETQRSDLENALQPLGFELIDDRKSRLIERIKNAIIGLVHHRDNELETNLSEFLAETLHLDYGYLSALFSEVEGITVEKYYIAQKIERVKELLVYDELSLSEIAHKLHYSSVAYLSNQFRKVTGLTPGHFKRIRADKRKPLDKV